MSLSNTQPSSESILHPTLVEEASDSNRHQTLSTNPHANAHFADSEHETTAVRNPLADKLRKMLKDVPVLAITSW